MNWNPAQAVYEQSLRTPERLALSADGCDLSYLELVRRAARLAGCLCQQGLGRGSRVGILGSRSLIAVEAVLAITWAGAAYVPLGLKWPDDRLLAVMALVDIDALIVDKEGIGHLTPALAATVKLLVLPDTAVAARWAKITATRVVSLDMPAGSVPLPKPVSLPADALAYVIFTSGTTGVPKGVMVATGSVAGYFAALGARKAMTPEDRASQFTELSFDPSIGEIFLPWRAGASLHVVPPVGTMSPVKFIREQRLTVWGSAPAAIQWMRDTRSLQPGSMPSLRYTSFGGEPLPIALVRAWQAAAPNSVIDNVYGPTEATVDCAAQRVGLGTEPVITPGRGTLAIGSPYPGTEFAVLAPDYRPVQRGQVGELAIAGRQLALGYLGLEALTAERFPVIGGKRWYLTGDLAMEDEAGVFHHLGRMDNQVKIHGHRVELEDIEAHLRVVAGTDQVAAVAWPVDNGVAREIVGFVVRSDLAGSRIREALRRRLPPYMVPASIHALPRLPRNATGKLDRRALQACLEPGVGEVDAVPLY